MIIPWGADAPIYHRPIATVALIVLSVAATLFIQGDLRDDWVLELGSGTHPAQWFTNLFLHNGWWHLVKTCLFLWTFGFVVEGKVGPFAFAAIYLGLGVIASALMQAMIAIDPPIAMMGPTTVIFGLLGICLVWAPRNEVHCIVWLRFTPSEFDLSILWFAVLYVALDVVASGLSGVVTANLTDRPISLIAAMGLNHAAGAALGFALGAAMLHWKWVDCEHWDLFAVLEHRTGQSRKQAKRRKRPRPVSAEFAPRADQRRRRRRAKRAPNAAPGSIEDPSAAALRGLRRHLEFGETEAAFSLYQKLGRKSPPWRPPEPDWRALIESLLAQKSWEDAVLVMRDHVRELPDQSDRVRLKLAQVLIQRLARPAQGLKVLEQAPKAPLPEPLATIGRKLTRQAEALRASEDGPIEIQDDLV